MPMSASKLTKLQSLSKFAFVVWVQKGGRALPPGLAPPRSSCRSFPSRLRANLMESRVGKRGDYRAAMSPPP